MGKVVEADNYKYCPACDRHQYNESWSCKYCGAALERATKWVNGTKDY